MAPTCIAVAPGVAYYPGYFDRAAQVALHEAIRASLAEAPLYRPLMPRTGKPFSVRMSNCGPLGWVSDETGYRYQSIHPGTGRPWPPIPESLLAAWIDLAPGAAPPQACLVNVYDAKARMGLHQDRDERELAAPIVSLSLGAPALFRIGGLTRNAPTRSFRLESGDALTFGGSARLVFHGVDRIVPGGSTLMPDGGRINLTLRRVTPASV